MPAQSQSSPVDAVRQRVSSEARLAGRRARKARTRLSYAAHRRVLSNRSSARRFRADSFELGSAQEEVLAGLREHGIAITGFEALHRDGHLWEQLASDVASFAEETEKLGAGRAKSKTPDKKDQFLVMRSKERIKGLKDRGVTPPIPALHVEDPWIRFGVGEPVLDTINAYRQMQTKLLSTDQWYTVPFDSPERRIGSQRWHRDPEDLHVIKVFVYFSEVDEGAGPFEYIRGSQEGGRYGHLWPWSLNGGYPPQAELDSRIPESEIITATGEAGTVILCDTSGLHRGGFAKTKPRILSVNAYVSPAAFISRRMARPFSVQPPATSGLRPAARFALS